MGWREEALKEIKSIKPYWIRKYRWNPQVVVLEDKVVLYLRFTHSHLSNRQKILRLEYGPNFPAERPREGFVNPHKWDEEGLEYWINDGGRAFKRDHNPPVICLEGTWGFHQVLHRERDPLQANLNKLLLEIQQCFDITQ